MRVRFGLRLASVFSATLLAAGCAGPSLDTGSVSATDRQAEEALQRELALKTMAEHQSRLNRVAYRMLTANVDACPNKTRLVSGFNATTIFAIGEPYRPAAMKLFGLGQQLKVLDVVAGSPADAAGLKSGDAILTFNGTPVPIGEQALAVYQKAGVDTTERTLEVRRSGEPLKLQFTARPACDIPVQVADGSAVNAYTDGAKVVVTRGMMNFVKTDDELALVVGHELAHVYLSHLQSKQANAVVGSIVDVLLATQGVNSGGAFGSAGAQAFSQDFEKEADYQGLYYVAKAGYPVSQAADFWRRMGVEHPGSIKANHSASHPSTPERFLGLRNSAAEIERKSAAGEPLKPQVRTTQPAPAGTSPSDPTLRGGLSR